MTQESSLANALAHCEEEKVKQLVQEKIDAGVPGTDILAECNQGMVELGNRFSRDECFIPDLMVGGKTSLDFKRKFHSCYASRKFNLSYTYSHEDILARYGSVILQVESVPGVFSSALGDIGYLFRTETTDELHEIARFIHQTEDLSD